LTCKLCFSCSWFAFDKERALQRDSGVDGCFEVLGGDVGLGSFKSHVSTAFLIVDFQGKLAETQFHRNLMLWGSDIQLP